MRRERQPVAQMGGELSEVEPYAYLHHVLTELPLRAGGADLRDLLPFNYAANIRP